MSRERIRSLLLFTAAAAIALLIVVKHFQLEALLVLTALNLFWGYLVAAAILFILLAWLFLMPTRWPLLLIVLVLCVDLFLPVARDFSANSNPATGPTLKVISFNWLGDNESRGPAFDWLAQQSADIVAIQEFSDEEPGVAAGLYALYPYHTTPAPDLIILSRYPIVEEKIRRVEDHAILRAALNIDGKRLTVWGVHPSTLRTSSDLAARNYYLTTLGEMLFASTGPIVVLGDFNATPWDPYFARVKRKGRLHEEPLLLPLPTRMGVRTGVSFLGSPIDHILTNEPNVLSGCHTGPALGSDHLPLICSLALGR